MSHVKSFSPPGSNFAPLFTVLLSMLVILHDFFYPTSEINKPPLCVRAPGVGVVFYSRFLPEPPQKFLQLCHGPLGMEAFKLWRYASSSNERGLATNSPSMDTGSRLGPSTSITKTPNIFFLLLRVLFTPTQPMPRCSLPPAAFCIRASSSAST